MSATRLWALINLLGLVGTAVGGLLLFYSLTLEPSNVRLVKVHDKELAICLDDKAVVAGYGGPLVVSNDPCPDSGKTGPTPQVTADRPKMAHFGVLVIIIGLFLQLPVAAAAIFAKETRS